MENDEIQSSGGRSVASPLNKANPITSVLVVDDDVFIRELIAGRLRETLVSRSANRMGILIDDLLAFSHAGYTELKKADADLDELLKDVLSDFQTNLKGRNIAWIIHPLPSVQADRALLRMVLVNLISNALKFTGAREEARIEIGQDISDNDEIVTYIRDNGAGFDPRYLGKLFGVFQRLHTHDEFEGTGIGLANVQRIILRHGGRVWADGAVDAGATFYFSIPK